MPADRRGRGRPGPATGLTSSSVTAGGRLKLQFDAPAPAQAGSGDLFDRLAAGLESLDALLPRTGADLAAAPPGRPRGDLALVRGAGAPATAADALNWLLDGAAAEAADLGADGGDPSSLPRAAARDAAAAALAPLAAGAGGGGGRGILRRLLRRRAAAAAADDEGGGEADAVEAVLEAAATAASARASKRDGRPDTSLVRSSYDAATKAAAANAAAAAAAAARERAVARRETALRTRSYTARSQDEARKANEEAFLGLPPPGGLSEDEDDTLPSERTAAAPTPQTDVRLPTAAKLPYADVGAARRGAPKPADRPKAKAAGGPHVDLVARGLFWAGAGAGAASSPLAKLRRALPARAAALLPFIWPDAAWALYASTPAAAAVLGPRWAGRAAGETAADARFAADACARGAALSLAALAVVPRPVPAARLAAALGDAIADAAAGNAAAAFRADAALRARALRAGALPPLPTPGDVARLEWPPLATARAVAAAGRALAAQVGGAAAAAAAAGGEGWVTPAGAIPGGTRFLLAAAPGDRVIVHVFPPPRARGAARPRPVLVAAGAPGSAAAALGALMGPGARDAVGSARATTRLAFVVNAGLPTATGWLAGLDAARDAPHTVQALPAATARFRLGSQGEGAGEMLLGRRGGV